MNELNLDDVSRYVEENIGSFHRQRLQGIENLQLEKILQRKNPYLFKAKHVLTAEQIVRGLLDAHISSNEEPVFGNWLEGLAIFINHKTHGGRKSGITGIDLEFDADHRRHIVTIKSGPNWGNSSQIAKMRADFMSAKKTLRTGNSKLNVVAVNGCCYGRERKPDKGDYFKYCGQAFWEFISGNDELFVEIIQPLGHKAKEKNAQFIESYSRVVNQFTRRFTNTLCKSDGGIDWDKLVRLNSARALPKKSP